LALAGPAANYTLMLLAVAGLHIGRSMGWLERSLETGQPNLLTVVLLVFFSLNLLLGTFNLLPVPPLDGSAGIMLFMSESRAQRYLDWLRGNSYADGGSLVRLLVFAISTDSKELRHKPLLPATYKEPGSGSKAHSLLRASPSR